MPPFFARRTRKCQKPFAPSHWTEALGSSGTVGAVSQLLAASQVTDGRITPEGLRWLMQQPGVAAIPKSSNPVRIAENLAVFDFQLDAGEMARIGALARADGRVSQAAWHPEWDAPAHGSAADKT